MARAWGVQCDSWSGTQYACFEESLWTGQVVKLATLSERPGNSWRTSSTQTQATASCRRLASCNLHDISSAVLSVGENRERQDVLWNTYFQDHSQWWDNRNRKRNSRLPILRYTKSREALWVDNCSNALVGAQPTTPHARVDHSASAASTLFSLSLDRTDKVINRGVELRLAPASVKNLCHQGQLKGAIEVLELLVGRNSGIDKHLFYFVLKECVLKKDLTLGGLVHALAVKAGFGSDTFLCNHFIRMYASHGKLQEAVQVFKGVALPDAFMWSSIISAHVKQGQAKQAIELYQQMRTSRVKPDNYVLVAALQACAAAADLESGTQMHDDVFKSGMEHDMFVCSCLVDMYAKCGSLKDARRVFDRLIERDVVTWNAMIAGYARVEGMGQEAIDLYTSMHDEGVAAPNAVTFVCLLQACANVGVSALDKGKELHSQLKERRLESNVIVGGSLVNMYAKCGSLKDARRVFDELGEKDVVTWTAMIAGYAEQDGMGLEALYMYSAMHKESMAVPDAVTFVCLLQACASVGVPALEYGKRLHLELKDRSLGSDGVVGGSLVNMYAKCGSLRDARIVFDGLGEKNVVTWNAMICLYAHEGLGQEALELYAMMQHYGTTPANCVTYVGLLEGCASVGALQQGKQLHSEIRSEGFESDVLIGSCLVKMYAKCGRLDVSREVFDRLPVKNLVTWTALLKGYAEHGEGGMAVQCFEELLEQEIMPDEVTYSCLLTACSHAGLVEQGQRYFETMVKRHRVQPNDQLYCCMVDLLGRSGHLEKAEQMLRASGLADDAVSWTALLSACKSYGNAELGRRCFEHLVNLEPTKATAYALLGGIYANAGRWDEADTVESLRRAAGARKMAAKACIEVKKEVHEFTVGEERSDVAATLRKMNTRVKEGGHVPQTQLVLRAMSEQEKEDALCGHAEKLALAYGLLNTPAGSTLVVTKNLRMCNDCHSSTKIMSRLEKRELVVRDGHKVHRFQNGVCSCQDRP